MGSVASQSHPGHLAGHTPPLTWEVDWSCAQMVREGPGSGSFGPRDRASSDFCGLRFSLFENEAK